MQKSEKTIIELGNKVLTLEIKDFGTSDIEIEDLLQIDMNAILEDIITFPIIFNRIANLKAQIDDLLREVQLDFKILEAQLYEEHKKAFITRGDKPTENALEAAIVRDPKYKVKKIETFK